MLDTIERAVNKVYRGGGGDGGGGGGRGGRGGGRGGRGAGGRGGEQLSYIRIDGKTPSTRRFDFTNQFQEDAGCRVRAGGGGLTSAASGID
jgi:hypothetical protein